jgi:hypothetical protein
MGMGMGMGTEGDGERERERERAEHTRDVSCLRYRSKEGEEEKTVNPRPSTAPRRRASAGFVCWHGASGRSTTSS